MSQLNPNAAEFVPISSPTRGVASPACQALMNDEVIAQSPRKPTPTEIDINLPNPQDFEKEVKNRPSDVFSNGQDSENNQRLSSQEVMENLLNGKNIEDIEFHPSTPVKTSSNTDEFHFGPNATPFSTPAKLLDQSEAALSTKAIFGDESTASYLEGKTLAFESSFTTDAPNSNPFTSEDVQDFQPQLNKPTDPMSMSFYQDENDANPFDLNKVQLLPDDDEFTDKPDVTTFGNDTISDLPEHDPLGSNEALVTDLDKPTESGDAQRLIDDSNILFGVSTLPITPEPTLNIEVESEKKEDIICDLPSSKSPILIEASKAPLPITPEPDSEEQDVCSAPKTPDVVSPIPQENIALNVDASSLLPPESPLLQLTEDFGICDVKPSVESDLIVESNVDSLEQKLTPSALSPEPAEPIEQFTKSPLPTEEISQLPQDYATIPEPTHSEISQEALDFLNKVESSIHELTEDFLCQSRSPEAVELNKSPVPTELHENISNVIEKAQEIREEFFPIFQKPIDEYKPEASAEKVREEFFPIFKKLDESKPEDILQSEEPKMFHADLQSPDHEALPEALDIIENQEQARTPEPVVEVQQAPKSPLPIIEGMDIELRSPEPIVESIQAKTPEPSLNELQNLLKSETEDILTETSLICEKIVTNVPKEEEEDEEVDILTLPEPVLGNLTTSEVVDFLQKSPELDFEKIEAPTLITPEPVEIVKEQVHNLETTEQLLMDEIQNILDTEPVVQTECEAKSPETIEESLDSEKRDLESPMEDVTSSLKDDNSITPEIIEEAKDISTEKEMLQDSVVPIPEPMLEISNTNYAQELSNAMQETSEVLAEKDSVTQISSTPNTTIETESVNTADVNSFLDRSNLLEITSPLSPSEQTVQEPLLTEDIIKIDLITPQYPEETVITPSEETKTETPTVEETPALAALPEVVQEAEVKEKADETIIAAAVGATAAVAATAAVVAATKDKKPAGKPLAKVTPTAKKTSKLGVPPSKTTAPKTTPSKTTMVKSALSSPTKPAATATKTTKPPVTTKPPPISRTLKPSPKPKTDTLPLTKSIEKKPLLNGDLKAPPKTSPGIKKVPFTTTTKSTVGARTSLAPKLSPTKTETKSNVTRTSTVGSKLTSSTTTTKPATTPKTATTTTTTSSKPRPTTLSSRSTVTSSTAKTASTVSATKTTVQSKTSTTASSPRTMTAKPKPPTSLTARPPTTTAAPKPKLSGLRAPSSKGPDTEKQLKDSANKQLTASRTTTSTRTTGTGKTTTTVRKTEAKSPSARTTTTKTTITTIKSTKKPTEITRITSKKTTPTKTTIKSQENGLTNGVTTIVQETTTILSTEPQLIKDLSPIENKLIVDNSQLTEANVAD